MSFLGNLFGRARGMVSGAIEGFKGSELLDPRYLRYLAFRRAYDGWVLRDNSRQTPLVRGAEYKRLKYNLNKPVVHMAAGWIAGEPVSWSVETGEGETVPAAGQPAQQSRADILAQQCADIWDRSFGNSEFLIASVSAIIDGDMPVIVRVGEDKKARVEFVDPGICFPEFDPHDCRKMTALTIRYKLPDRSEYRERLDAEKITVWIDDNLIGEEPHPLGEVPAVWIPNVALRGQSFGRSDLDNVAELVGEYDHLCEKQTQIIDYYAHPSIAFIGVKKKDVEISRDVRTVFYLPAGGDAKFLEWQGRQQTAGDHLDRIRMAISEVSQTPAIAFGEIDSGFQGASGISLKVLYGPIEEKTLRRRASWGPQLERVMFLALKAEQAELEGLGPENIDLNWGDAAPHNETEHLAQLETKVRLGLPRSQALRELNYSEEMIARFEIEKEAERKSLGEAAMRLFDAGEGDEE